MRHPVSFWLAPFLLAGCFTTTPNNDDTDTPFDPGYDPYVSPDDFELCDCTPFGRVNGLVLGADLSPLEGVDVRLSTGDRLSTDANGFFQFDSVAPGQVMVSVEDAGYTTANQRVTIDDWETESLRFTVLPVGASFSFDAADGGVFQEGQLTLRIPPDAFVDADGNAVTGEVELLLTAPDIMETGLIGAPGNFRGIDENGDEVSLLSFGFFETRALQGGEEINLAEGVEADVSYEMMDEVPEAQAAMLDAGTMPFWWWNPEEAIWEWQVTEEIQHSRRGDFLNTSLPHFSSWNWDWAYQSSCVTFNVVDPLGKPLEGASVVMDGISYSVTHYTGAESGTTDDMGQVTLWGLPNAEAFVQASITVDGQEFSESIDPFTLYGAVDMNASSCPYSATLVIPACIVGGDVKLMVSKFWSKYPDGTIAGWTTPTGMVHFYEPMGNYELCREGWMEMEDDECVHVGSDSDFSVTPESRVSRPAGEKVHLRDGAFAVEYQPYHFEAGDYNEDYYTIQDENLLGMGAALKTDTFYDLKVKGEQGATPGFKTDDAVWMPSAPEVEGADQTLSFPRSSGLRLTMPPAGDENGLYVTMTSMDADAGTVDVESTILCRFQDDGDVTIPPSALQNLNPGGVYMQVFRAGYGYVEMPTGYATRATTMNATVIMGEAR